MVAVVVLAVGVVIGRSRSCSCRSRVPRLSYDTYYWHAAMLLLLQITVVVSGCGGGQWFVGAVTVESYSGACVEVMVVALCSRGTCVILTLSVCFALFAVAGSGW